MANVPTLQNWDDAKAYLQNLEGTIVRDIKPLLDTEGAAPFTISREVLCYIDHLAHLYTGRGEVGQRFNVFLKDIAKTVDQNYSVRSEEIYKMYRNGTVHEFEPKVLENKSGDLLGWLCYKGQRIDKIEISGVTKSVTHLVPIGENGKYSLPVSTECLVSDLIEFIKIFTNSGPDNVRKTLWNRAAIELVKPVPFDFVL